MLRNVEIAMAKSDMAVAVCMRTLCRTLPYATEYFRYSKKNSNAHNMQSRDKPSC